MADDLNTTEPIVTERGVETPQVTATHPMPWWQILLVRGVRTAISAFMSYGGIAILGTGELPTEKAFLLAGKIALGACVWSMAQNGYEILKKLDQTHPELRA